MSDVPYEVRESAIHGKGLFAVQPIESSEVIGELTGEPTDEDGPHVLWIVEDDGSEHGLRGTNELRFVNHAEGGNAHFEGTELVALRDIAPGDEITFDYDTGLEAYEDDGHGVHVHAADHDPEVTPEPDGESAADGVGAVAG